MLTIGELAAFAGVSTRTVRYYHGLGLLPEPSRDESGYRRYTADDVVRLVRVVALAAAGVPLARVGDLLEADGRTVAEEVQEVDADLRAEIRRLMDWFLDKTESDVTRHLVRERVLKPYMENGNGGAPDAAAIRAARANIRQHLCGRQAAASAREVETALALALASIAPSEMLGCFLVIAG